MLKKGFKYLVTVSLFLFSFCTTNEIITQPDIPAENDALYPLLISDSSIMGKIQSNLAPGLYKNGSTITLTAVAGEGFEFDHWAGGNINGKKENPISTQIGTTNKFSAVFKSRLNITILLPDSGGHTIPLTMTQHPCPYDTVVNIQAVPDTGWEVDYWEGVANDSDTVVVDSNKAAIDSNKNVIDSNKIAKDSVIITSVKSSIAVKVVTDTLIMVHFKHIPVPSNVICVRKGAHGKKDGSDWVDAFDSLPDAIKELNSATNKTELWIATGEHFQKDNIGLLLKTGVKIYGGFNGFESKLSSRNWITNTTTITGKGLVNYIFYATANDHVLIDGLTIQNAKQSLIYTACNSMTIKNCVFKNNNYSGLNPNAAAVNIFSATDSMTIENCVFYNNRGIGGSCILISSNAPGVKMINSVLVNSQGPVIYDYNTSPNKKTTLYNCTIANNDNTISALPGGIAASGKIDIKGCIIWGNTNISDPQVGTQIDSADTIEYSCIQDIFNGTVGVTKHTNTWSISPNIDSVPNFTSTTLPASDGLWFSKDSNIPFIPKQTVCLKIVKYLNMPEFDIRNVRRKIAADMGAYETSQ